MSPRYGAVYFLLGCTLIVGCNGRVVDLPVSPGTDPDLYPIKQPQTNTRSILAAGKINFDFENLTAEFVPSRTLEDHYNVTPLLNPPKCGDCVNIDILQVDPIQKFVKVEITLTNPTALTGYDVRGIAMTNDENVRLLNADAYTKLWDDGGEVTINPFKAFAVDMPHREMLPHASRTREYNFVYAGLQGLTDAILIVDVSWPDNCEEPYEIANAQSSGTFFDYEPQNISCVVLDWNSDVSTVTVDLRCLGQFDETVMTHQGGNDWVTENITWRCGGYGPGTYRAMITAKSAGSEFELYNYVDVTIEASPPTVGWARSWGSGKHDRGMYSMIVDGTGNVYIPGSFMWPIDFDPGPGIEEHNPSGSTPYISKFDAVGNFQWVRIFDCNYNYSVIHYDIEYDNSGNIIFISSATGDLDPGPGEDTHVGAMSLIKFDPECNYIWGFTWDGIGSSILKSIIEIDTDDNIYIAGSYRYSFDFDPGPGEDIHETTGQTNAFVCKLDPVGNYQWAVSWGPDGEYENADLNGLVLDNNGYFYVTGEFETSFDFDPGPDIEMVESVGGYDAYLGKFSENGEFQWVKTWGNDYNFGFSTYYEDTGASLALDSANIIYICGHFFNHDGTPVDFDPGDGTDYHVSNGSWDIYLSKFNTDGDYITGVTFGGPSYDYCYSLAKDSLDNVYLTGSFRNLVDFDPGLNFDWHKSTAGNNIYLTKLDSDLEFIWARSFGEENPLLAHLDYGYGVIIDNLNNVYVCGRFWPRYGSLDFNPGPGVDYQTSVGGWDPYLFKIDENGNW